MSSPVDAILTGTFTSDGTVKNLSLPSGYTKFEMVNITDWGSTAANTNVMTVEGWSSMAAGSAKVGNKTNGAATIAIPSMITSGGLTFVADSGNQSPANALTITAISQANPAVVSCNPTTGLGNGDIVRVINDTGMLQIAGMDFTIGGLIANTSFTLVNLDSSGFGAAATAGSVRRIPFDARFYPRRRFITNISVASQAIITMSVTHGFTIGQAVRIYCTSDFGMTQINGLLGNIVAINAADASGITNTITVDIDSSSFTAFAFPTSAVAAKGITFPQVVPVGEDAVNSSSQAFGNLLDDATRNVSFTGVQIGTSAQTNAKLYQWTAYKGTSI